MAMVVEKMEMAEETAGGLKETVVERAGGMAIVSVNKSHLRKAEETSAAGKAVETTEDGMVVKRAAMELRHPDSDCLPGAPHLLHLLLPQRF